VLVVLPLGAVSLGMFWLMARTHRTQPKRDEGQVIDNNWRELKGYYPPQAELPAPASYKRNVPVTFSRGTNSRETLLSTAVEGGSELTCPVGLLQTAAAILSDGQQPTRASFNARGVMSSSEISSAVDFLRAHGFIRPTTNGANSPARWGEGITPAQLLEFVDAWSQ
jgi:hypothetical protein